MRPRIRRANRLFAVGIRLAELTSFIETDLRGLLVFALNGLVDFAAMYLDLAGGFDAKPNFVATHVDDGYHDIVTDDDALVALSGKHKHGDLVLEAVKVVIGREASVHEQRDFNSTLYTAVLKMIGPLAYFTQVTRATLRT